MADKLYYDSATGTTFKEAFADARKEGQKVFEWNGKKYNTKLKGEDAPKPKQSKYKESDTIEAGKREKSAPKEESKKEEKSSSGAGAAAAAAGTALGAAALLSGMRKAERGRKEVGLEQAAKEREGRAKSGSSLRMPGSRMDKNDPYSMTLGSDLDPKSMMKNSRLSGDTEYKKGGKVKKFAAGGLAENVPAKSNMPPRQKIPGGPPKKSAPPLPEWLKNERENQERDRRTRKEREDYEEYDKNRLKDQGSFKKGGMTASRRGDGIAMRGKTKGRIV